MFRPPRAYHRIHHWRWAAVLIFISSFVTGFQPCGRVAPRMSRLGSRAENIEEQRPTSEDDSAFASTAHDIGEVAFGRRAALSRMLFPSVAIMTFGTFAPEPSYAGEVGTKINAAVTQSDLGISVRRSVVRGAQLIDQADLKWEKFSDKFGLGAERSKRDARPAPRDVPDPLPLDKEVALSMLKAADASFLSTVPIGEEVLGRQIVKVDSLVRKSFERSGLTLDEANMDAETFNFLAYVHFKAFNDILVEKQINFNQFRKKFEIDLGSKLCAILGPKAGMPVVVEKEKASTASSEILKERLTAALKEVDEITENLRLKGFVALVERSQLESETVDDWSEDLSDLEFSIALDKDATQNAQILLQEQGFRLHPDFARFAVTAALKKNFAPVKEEVMTEEYYMDTSYSSDPDEFDVKQVLLNIVIESA